MDTMALTNLTDLSVYYNRAISGDAFKHITRLSNLKVLAMAHTKSISGKELAALLDLPNLKNFAVHYDWDDTQDRFDEAIAIYGQLSRLTSLNIGHYHSTLNFDSLTRLTNLEELQINSRTEKADFSTLSHVALLDFQPQEVLYLKICVEFEGFFN
jgi:hypothetical protein